jgi:predicted RNA-binding Zn-ribbon protein involved in translation (DUF1610 family)
MVGAEDNDLVYIDAINTESSLNRDIGALLKLKANLDESSIRYRMFLAVCNNYMEDKHVDGFDALVKRTPKFIITYGTDLKRILRKLILESALEKVAREGARNLDRYFHDACPKCGTPYSTNMWGQGTRTYFCPKCGFKWSESIDDYHKWREELDKIDRSIRFSSNT